MTQAESPEKPGWLASYQPQTWQFKAFKLPIVFWRLGCGSAVGKVLVLFTHTGRISGLPRQTVTEYHPLDGVIYLPCAYGEKAQWYQNILADPIVTVQTDGAPFSAQARRVTADAELARFYQVIMRRNPLMFRSFVRAKGIDADDIADVLAKKDRFIIVAFDPVKTPGPPPVPRDLNWMLPLIGLMSVLLLLRSRAKKRQG